MVTRLLFYLRNESSFCPPGGQKIRGKRAILAFYGKSNAQNRTGTAAASRRGDRKFRHEFIQLAEVNSIPLLSASSRSSLRRLPVRSCQVIFFQAKRSRKATVFSSRANPVRRALHRHGFIWLLRRWDRQLITQQIELLADVLPSESRFAAA